MEKQWIRETMETEQIISAKPTQAVVETEITMPGGLREEAKVFFADASAVISGGEISGSRVTAEGRVTFHVLYAQGDLSQVNVLETTADFTQSMPLQEEMGGLPSLRAQPRVQMQQVSARAMNGRLLLRAVLNLTAKAALCRTVSMIRDAADGEALERSMQTISVQRTVGEGEARSLLREEFELSDVLNIKNTLFASAQAQVEDILGGADGKATVTGTISIDAYHTSDLPGRPLVYTRHAMPFEQQVNLSGSSGDFLTARSDVRDVAVLSQANEDGGRILRAEVQLSTVMTAMEARKLTMLEDAYTLTGEALETQTQTVSCRSDTIHETASESGKTVLTLAEGSPRVKTALLGFVRPVLVSAQRQKDKLAVDGVVDAAVLYLTDDSSEPVAARQEEPFHCVFTTSAAPEDDLTLTALQVEPSVVTGDRVELKDILRLQAEGVRQAEARVITDIQAVEAPEKEQGIVLSFLQPGETLWDLAKRHRIPLAELNRLNPQLTDQPAPGTAVVTYIH